MKFRITVPATTSNLGPGFDYLGMSLTLYNTYEFETSDKFIFNNFENIDKNLVYETYRYIMEKYSTKIIPISITLVKADVPTSRGLGSSATAIIAGMVSANFMLQNVINEETLVREMIKYERHPDNILSAYYGGLVSSIKDNDKYYHFKHKVSPDLLFTLVVPPYFLKTELARSILPQNLTYQDTLYNASRAFLLKDALEKGDMEILRIACKDAIHEKYRGSYIKDYPIIKELESKYEITVNISGSGSTIIIMSKSRDFMKDIDKSLNVIPVTVDDKGMMLEVIE